MAVEFPGAFPLVPLELTFRLDVMGHLTLTGDHGMLWNLSLPREAALTSVNNFAIALPVGVDPSQHVAKSLGRRPLHLVFELRPFLYNQLSRFGSPLAADFVYY